jgi:hypothetical protein
MKMISRLGNLYKPIDGFQTGMGLGFIIVYAERRGMCDENIQCPPVLYTVQEQAG